MLCPICHIETPADSGGCAAHPAGRPSAAADIVRVFVGRDWELGALKAAIDDATTGRGRLVMVAGEPGIGKTRLCDEVVGLARREGVWVFRGRCLEEPGAPPYWPWRQIIRGYLREHGDHAALTAMVDGAAVIAGAVPEMRALAAGVEWARGTQDPESARFLLFDAITTLFQRVSEAQPLILVLDDLHWADPSTLRLLEFLATEIENSPMLVIGTYRDDEVSRGHPVFHLLGSLARLRHFTRITLGGLSEDEVGTVLRAAGVMIPPPGLAAWLHDRTAGNPLFVREMVRLLANQGALETGRIASTESREGPLPEGVREVIGRRLRRLSEHCNQMLTWAAVSGREFSFEILRRLMEELPEDTILGALEEALDAHVIEELLGAGDRYQFTHALVQETLSRAISGTRRAGLHARIGSALEDLYGDRANEHAAELVNHFLEAQSVSGTDRAVHYCLKAGEQALEAYAYEEAAGHFERGLAAKQERAVDTETARLLSGLGRALAASLERHEMQRAIDTLSAAFDAYVKAGEPGAGVTAAIVEVSTVAGVTQSSGLINRAFEYVDAGSRQWGWLRLLQGKALAIEISDFERGQAALESALEVARACGDRELEARALAVMCETASHHLRVPNMVSVGTEAVRACRAIILREPLMRALLYSGIASLQLGDPRGTRERFAEVRRLAERQRNIHWLENILFNLALCAMQTGDWEDAREPLTTAEERGFRVAFLTGLRVLLPMELGQFVRGEEQIQRLFEGTALATPGPSHWYTMPSIVIPLASRITGDKSHLDIARKAALAVLDSPYANPNRRIQADLGLAMIAVLDGDADAAREMRRVLSGYDVALSGFMPVAVARVRGLTAAAAGDLDLASADFEEALAFCRPAAYRPELAWTCSDYSEMLLNRNAPGDREKTARLQEEGVALARELGMKPLEARLEHLGARLAVLPVSRHDGYPAGLTHREVEVLRLVAAGRTNRQIGEELFISYNTVAIHVKNILGKTGTANRTELAAFAVRNSLAGA